MSDELSLEDVIGAYKHGLFPMAESRDSNVFHWYDPPKRGQLSISQLHIPERLRRTALKFPYKIVINKDFESVIDGCAKEAPDRKETWINKPIRDLFIDLFRHGYAHSVEAYEDNKLVGGLYGLAIGGAFMGESMFSRARDASKLTLIHLCARLYKGGFTLLDTQFVNPHLKQFGVYELDREDYLIALQEALKISAEFDFEHENEQDLVRDYLAQNIN